VLLIQLYRLDAYVIPVRPGEAPPPHARFIGYLELHETEVAAWREAVTREIERTLTAS